MENSIPEKESGSDKDSAPESGETEVANENEAPQPFSKKVLWWIVFAVLVVVSVVFMRSAFPTYIYEKAFAFYSDLSGFSLRHFVKCLIRLGFSLVWVGLFFALLRKLPLWGRGIILVIFFLPIAFALYLQKYYGMEIDLGFITDCLNTNWEETRAFISFHAIATLLAFIVAMFALAWLLEQVNAKLLKSKIFIGGLLLVFVVMTALPHSRAYIFPLGIATTVKGCREMVLSLKLIADKEDEPQKVERVPAEISHVKAAPVVVLHIGETARADHAPFNGYGRNTMPNMLKEHETRNLISFPKCVSFSTETILSVPGILTPSTVLNNALQHPTFIPALNQSGVETCGFFSSVNADKYTAVRSSWIGLSLGRMQKIICIKEPALALLPKIRDTVSEDERDDPSQERFYLYYGEGSHEPFTHYDYDRHAVFKPNGTRKYADERDVNNYDNTFIATDEFCEGFIDSLRDENAVYIFVGDHGTMIGEDGIEGRPFKRKEVRHVLFFIWCSEKFKVENPELWATLLRNREQLGVISHDFVYNSVLHLFSLKTPFYNEKSDLFSDSAEPFPTEMPDAETFGPIRFGENAEPVNVGEFEQD